MLAVEYLYLIISIVSGGVDLQKNNLFIQYLIPVKNDLDVMMLVH